jgi:flagellar biosynthesis chaperone FliJ
MELEQALVEHQLAREQMIAAKRRVSALERLAARRWREWQDEFARAEVIELDDVVNSRVAAARLEAFETAGTGAEPGARR